MSDIIFYKISPFYLHSVDCPCYILPVLFRPLARGGHPYLLSHLSLPPNLKKSNDYCISSYATVSPIDGALPGIEQVLKKPQVSE